MTRFIIPLLILFALVGAAHALGLGEGNRFGRMGSISTKAGTPAPPSPCDGTIDLSTGCVQPMLR